MASQKSQALTRRASETDLMPPPPTKRIKRPPKVLDEDSYTDALSSIIARDFFPGLLESRTQQEYLDALESDDREWIVSARRKLGEVMTPGFRRSRRGTSLAQAIRAETPQGFGGDTPMSMASGTSTARDSTAATQADEVDINMSLDRFQAKYTSEDNESFNQLLDKQNQTKAERYAWMWAGNKIPAARQIKYRERQAQIAADKERGSSALTLRSPDERRAMPDGWKAMPNNAFMFEPDGIEDRLESVHQAAEAQSRAPPKAVVYDNTRLAPVASPQGQAPSIPPSPSLSAVQDAIAGRPRPTASEPGFSGGETPRVNGYTFVDDEPTPEETGLAAASTVSLLGPASSTTNPFKIKEQSKRESLHHRMVDRVAKNNRAGPKPGGPGSTPVPKFTSSPRIGRQLTPAAQRLWSKMGSPATAKKTPSGVFGGTTSTTAKSSRHSGLRFRWTPTPRAQRKEG